MNIKKIIAVAGIIAIAGLAGLTACSHSPEKRGERMLSHLDSEVADLKLTADQQKKYDELRSKIKTDMATLMSGHREKASQVRTELNAEKPDMAKIAGMVKKFESERPALMSKYADEFLAFYNTLDDNQKSQVIEKLRKAEKRFGKHMQQ